MKRYSLILCLVLILSLSGVASAQIVLGPPPAAAGGVGKLYVTIGGSPNISTSGTIPYPYVGGMAYTGTTYGTVMSAYYNIQGVFEFNLSPAIPPTFTSKDFTAKLDGLSATTITGTGAINIDLFDMGDGSEDGVIDVSDFNSTLSKRIARGTHTFGVTPANFNDIDVTCAVRNDLFGDAQTDFSGFILKPNLNEQIQGVAYNPATPTLTITTGVSGPKCGGGGGGGGGCFIANATR